MNGLENDRWASLWCSGPGTMRAVSRFVIGTMGAVAGTAGFGLGALAVGTLTGSNVLGAAGALLGGAPGFFAFWAVQSESAQQAHALKQDCQQALAFCRSKFVDDTNNLGRPLLSEVANGTGVELA